MFRDNLGHCLICNLTLPPGQCQHTVEERKAAETNAAWEIHERTDPFEYDRLKNAEKYDLWAKSMERVGEHE